MDSKFQTQILAGSKSPSLALNEEPLPHPACNIALTAPYMHVGCLKSLKEVIDHYSQGVIRTEIWTQT
ncbi:MAG: hypothetical protein NTV80_22680 [Verrucomicrobia bacterium]|nr:hypothetical protein [Verrucomicrobiota bacterium]